MNTQIITYNINHKGINDLKVVKLISGYLTLACFHGKTAMQRAKAAQRKFNAGQTI